MIRQMKTYRAKLEVEINVYVCLETFLGFCVFVCLNNKQQRRERANEGARATEGIQP